ncbi:MAG: DegQ family serine endoprotease [Pseudomonadota bacterium]
MFKKRFSLWTVMGVAALSVIAVGSLLVWTGSVKSVRGAQVVDARSYELPVQKAAWFQAQPKSFADLAEKVQAAVVNISTSKKMRRPGQMMPFPRFGPKDPFEDFFEKFFEGMPQQERDQHSLGSGFIIDEKGTILTNSHVVSQADEIEVGLSDGRELKAEIVGMDEKTDIAVIRIKSKDNLPMVPLGNSKNVRPGDWVMAIGNPFGLEHTVTVGVVSAKGRLIGGGPYAKFIQTDASINPGNSGGPLFNLDGEVIGINTMIYAGGQGIGFAIPIDLAKQLLPQLVEKGSVSHGWLGVAIQKITPELAKSFGLKKEKGALITEVFSGSPAAKAGLQRGDVILEFNGEKVEDPHDLSLYVGNTSPDTEAKVIALRDGENKEFSVKIAEQQAMTSSRGAPETGKVDRGKADALGLVVRTITSQDAMELDVPGNFRGIVVQRVEPDSVAERAGVQSGDVVLEINDASIQNIKDYDNAVKDLKEGKLIRLFIKRGKSSIYLAFTL